MSGFADLHKHSTRIKAALNPRAMPLILVPDARDHLDDVGCIFARAVENVLRGNNLIEGNHLKSVTRIVGEKSCGEVEGTANFVRRSDLCIETFSKDIRIAPTSQRPAHWVALRPNHPAHRKKRNNDRSKTAKNKCSLPSVAVTASQPFPENVERSEDKDCSAQKRAGSYPDDLAFDEVRHERERTTTFRLVYLASPVMSSAMRRICIASWFTSTSSMLQSTTTPAFRLGTTAKAVLVPCCPPV